MAIRAASIVKLSFKKEIGEMNLEESLNLFLNNQEEKVFLLRGEWGTGKTTAVDNWIEKKKSETHKDAKVKWKFIKLSFFGIKDVNQLNTELLYKSSLLGKTVKVIKRIIPKIRLSHYVEFQLSISGMFELATEWKFQKESKRKKKKITKYLIILDDIERKDNLLSLDQIFGFVDHLGANKTKVIMITNSEGLKEADEFRKFKEKVVNREYVIQKPESYLKRTIFGNDELYEKLKIDAVDNLRTIIKFKEIIKYLNLPNNLVSTMKYKAILLSLESIENNKYGYNHFKEEQLAAMNLYRVRDESEEEKEFEKEHAKQSQAELFASYFSKKTEFDHIENVTAFLSTVYLSTASCKYDAIKDYPLEFSSCPYPPLSIRIDANRFKENDTNYLENTLNQIHDAMNKNYSEASIFIQMCVFDINFKEAKITNKSLTDKKNKTFEEVINYISSKTISSDYFIGHEFKHIQIMSGYSNYNFEAYYENFYQALIKETLNTFKTINAWTRNKKQRFEQITNMTKYKFEDNEEGRSFVDSIVGDIFKAIQDKSKKPGSTTTEPLYFLSKQKNIKNYLSSQMHTLYDHSKGEEKEKLGQIMGWLDI